MNYSGILHLTNMCLVYDDDGNILVQDRLKNDWPGINLPGGNVEVEESLEESAIREMKEETGLDVYNLERCGFYEWNLPNERVRHLVVLFRTKNFKGEIKSSKEGRIFWINVKDIDKYKLSTDLDKVLKECFKGIDKNFFKTLDALV